MNLGLLTSLPPMTLAMTCAIYTRENDLLNEPGWICFRCLALCKKQLLCQVKQAKLRSF